MDEDFPGTLLELERRFSSEEACAEYLAALRWPGGWVCPRCAGADAWSIRRNRWLCDHCRYEMSVTAGTIFQDSHLPLTIWFRAMWQITSQKNGISALGFNRRRFFLDDDQLLHLEGKTCALSNQWGIVSLPLINEIASFLPPEIKMTYSKCV